MRRNFGGEKHKMTQDDKKSQQPREPRKEDVIYVSAKTETGSDGREHDVINSMTYAMDALKALGRFEKVTIKARGRAISKAVTAALQARKLFPGVLSATVDSINIFDEEIEGSDGRPHQVSAMEIVLQRATPVQAVATPQVAAA